MSDQDHNTLIIGQDISPALAATAILQRNGFNLTDTGKAFGITKQAVIARNRNLPPSLDLTSKKTVKLASRAVKSLVQGRTFGEIDKVKDSTALAAAQMIYDRAQPVRNQDSQAGTSYTQVNINLFSTGIISSDNDNGGSNCK